MPETGTTAAITDLPPSRKLHSPHRRAPDHPPYSEMIHEAIGALAEAGGSTVAAIERHVRSAHRDLPWGHRNLLPYYLGKLVAAGEITRTHSGRYSIGPISPDAAPPPSPPPLNISEGENGATSPLDFSTGLPHELGGEDGGLGNGDLVEEGVLLAMLLPGHRRCALPKLSIRHLKRRLRERNASFSSPTGADPLASSPLLRRRGRPPKPEAAIVLEGDQEEEAAAGDEGRDLETKFVDFSSLAGPAGSPVLPRRGRGASKRNDATLLRDEQHGTGCRDDPEPSSPSPNGGNPSGSPVMKRRGRRPKCSTAVVIQGEAAAGDGDRQSEQMLVSSSSSIEDPVNPPVIKRRGRPPNPKAAMTLPDDGRRHESAAGVSREGPKPELKLLAFSFSSVGGPTSSAASPPINRRGRPPNPKAEPCREPERRKDDAIAQSCKEGTESDMPGHGGTREEAGVGEQDAIAAPEDERRVSTRRGLAGACGGRGPRRP